MARDTFLVRENLNYLDATYRGTKRFILDYPASPNLGIMWNFGFAAFVFLLIQLVTGFMLSMHYVAHADMAFVSVELIMRDVNHG